MSADKIDTQTPLVLEGVAYTACGGDGPGALPKLCELDMAQLLSLRAGGMRRLVTPDARCEGCDAEALHARLAALNAVLVSRGAQPITLETRPPAAWRREADAAARRKGKVDPARRRLFAAFRAPEPEPALPAPGPDALYLFAPQLDPARCVGCDACARLCPTDAITLDESAYVIDADRCDGCGLCLDGCDVEAVTVAPCAPAPQTRLPLRERACQSCRAVFREPEAAPEQALCRICRVRDHRRNLFQVLE